jgi:pyrroline-5-carboxylate reductase
MLSSETPLLVIGGGNMAQAMIAGWLESTFLRPDELVVIDRHPEKTEAMRTRWPFTTVTSADEVSDLAPAIIMLAVKPYAIAELLPLLKERYGLYRPLITSVAAGLSIASYEAGLWEDAAVCRIMPNTPSAVKEGMSVAAFNAHCGNAHRHWAQEACRAFGAYAAIDESQMHLATAVSGSGPAYIFYLMEQMIACATARGMDETTARQLVTQTVRGAATFAQHSPLEISQLRTNVTSPGGTTQAGLEQLMVEAFDSLIEKTIDAAMSRSEAMAG